MVSYASRGYNLNRYFDALNKTVHDDSLDNLPLFAENKVANMKQVLTRVNTARTALEKAVGLLDVLENTPSRANVYSQSELVKIIGRLEGVAGILRTSEASDASTD